MANITLSSLSLEKVSVAITATANPTGDTVQMAVALNYTNPTTWVSATWVTVAGVYYATVLIGPGSAIGTLPKGIYSVWVKITDNPEIPVLQAADTITII
jgi:hypothetical protein